MTEWTNSAKAELERYCSRVQESLAGSGADGQEVIDDLKRHVEAEIAAAQLRVVTAEDLRVILARIGEPTSPKEKEPSPAGVSAPVKNESKPRKPGFLLLFFGVILPAITIGFELTTHMSASVLFDPLRTVWHLLMVAFVPLANLAVWVAVRKGWVKWRNSLSMANSFAIGIAGYYSLLYLTFMPFACIGLLYFGAGLMPLAPCFSFIAALVLRGYLRKQLVGGELKKLYGLGWGLAGAAAVLALVALPVPVTRYFAQMAISDSPATANSGIHWLRAVGREETLLEDCYRNGGWSVENPFGFILDGRPVTAEQARTIYFRVTGRPFNSQPPPHPVGFARGWDLYDEFDWDNGLGGEEVAERLKGLSLHSSRVDGIVEPDAALAYYEWTMEFKNVATMQREARAQILLPPGGVVSRLTLWVNGEEREAAFGGRSQVRTAYQNVAIERRRDPVLVTTCGPDRILMQCFPVQPNGGVMKVRIGITAPMLLEKADSGMLRWPVFLERNFNLPQGLKHSVWMESERPIETNLKALGDDPSRTNRFVVHGDLSDQQLNEPEASIIAQRSGESREVWANCDEGDQVVRQKIVEKEEAPPARVVVVLDGSLAMKEFVPAIATAIRKLPEGVESEFILASDEANKLSGDLQKANTTYLEGVAKLLPATTIIGGQDNVPALLRGWDLAAESKDGVVLWIHGPQPIILESTDALRQRFERQPGSPRLYEIQTRPGPNRVVEKLDGLLEVISLPRFGKLEDDLNRIFSKWRGGAHVFSFSRELVEKSSLKDLPRIKEASQHVTRLWAFENVLKLAGSRQIGKAMTLAENTHLVTPVSGAVVLETKSQFDQAGLTPADAEKVPVIPEPGTWALLLLGAMVLCARFYWKRSNSS